MTRLNAFENSSGTATPSKKKVKNRVFYSAVVIDFISNPEQYISQPGDNSPIIKEDQDTSGTVGDLLRENLANGIIINKIPRNAVIAQVVSDRGSKNSGPEIFYPFFSPHLCMPVKSGEQIWVIYEGAGSRGSLGYWICRKPGDLQVDDINYTHHDRTTLALESAGSDSSSKSSFEGSSDTDPDPFSFPLGGRGQIKNNTLKGPTPYTDIIEKSLSYKDQFVGEPVPRFSKRAADLIFQGSNNTLISLGQDRLTATDPDSIDSTTAAGSSAATQTGTVDIVAGRGQTSTTSAIEAGEAIDRGYDEINKAPGINGLDPNLNEGDPDFINDLSRIYVSMKTSGDTNFDLEFPDTESGTTVDAVDDDAYVIIKSNNTRVIAREDGTIRIIKEGEKDKTKATITMEADGTIMIDGPRIVIGSGIEKGNGDGNQIFLGRDANEPIVLGTQLVKVLSAIVDVLDNHIHPSAVGPTSQRLGGTEKTLIGKFSNTDTAIESDLEKILSRVGMTK